MSFEALTANQHPLVDLRSKQAFIEQHIVGACHLEAQQLMRAMHQLPANHVPLNLLGSQSQLAQAKSFLLEKGYQVLTCLVDNPALWQQAEQLQLTEQGANCVSLWQANPLLLEAIEQIEQLTTGRTALDLASGAGRDAVYLAQRNWQVTALDYKADALMRAEQLAESVQVSNKLSTLELDIEQQANWPALTAHQYDLVLVMRYCHRPLFPVIEQLLSPGGILCYSTFMVGSEQFGSPKNPAFLLKDNELAEQFQNLKIIINERRQLADGRPISYFVAQKPN